MQSRNRAESTKDYIGTGTKQSKALEIARRIRIIPAFQSKAKPSPRLVENGAKELDGVTKCGFDEQV